MTQPVFEVRLAMASNGYTPIPVIGKIPPLEEWQKVENVSRETLEAWDRDCPTARNTGILTRLVPTLDLDVLNEPAAIAAENLVRECYGSHGKILVRIGRAPRRAIPFRIKGDPFNKRAIKFAVLEPGAEVEKIEFLADGQQFVGHGIHPDTQSAYVWIGGDPTTVKYQDLPEIHDVAAYSLLEDVAALLVRKFGYEHSYWTSRSSKKKRRKPEQRATATTIAPDNPKRDLAWAKAALEAECARIADAPQGDRNDQLNKSAFSIFQIVHGNPGLLDEQEVRAQLYAAATMCGLVHDDGEDSVWRTIESGEAGAESQPRKRPLSAMEQLVTPDSGNGLDLTGVLTGAIGDAEPEPAPEAEPMDDAAQRRAQLIRECSSDAADERAEDTSDSSASVSASTAIVVTAAAEDEDEDEDDDVIFATSAPASQRRTIELHKGNYHLAADAAEDALLAADWCPVYQRGGFLVRPVRERLAAADNRETIAWRFTEVQLVNLLEMFERVASFKTFNKRAGEWVTSNCPDRIGKMVMARQGGWQFPIVLGIVHTPPFRRDGTLSTTPGYDPNTWLIFKPDGEVFAPIPDKPSRDQALAALELLKDPIKKFPFKSEADRAVVLSLFLTGLCRRVLDFAPLHGMSATAAGTGKSMLVDLCSILLSGYDVPVISVNSSNEEVEKRVGASLIAGDAIVSFDNCNSPLGHPLICQMLSQRWVRVRVLGLSKQVDAPTSTLVCATGNSLTLEGDMTRRAVRCELDAGVERPELREFDFNPRAVVRARRGALVSAALTILRAGRLAESAGWLDANGAAMKMPAPLGGFEMWSAWVRNPLLWLGCADPCGSMEQIYEGDPLREMHIAVLIAWQTTSGLGIDSEFQTQQLIDQAYGFANTELRAALLSVAKEQGSSGTISAKRLGHWLRKVDGKICQGLCIRRRMLMGHTMWKLVKA